MARRTRLGAALRIDRVFPGVGRIAVTSGTRLRTEFTKRNALLTSLAERGRLDLLRALRQGDVTMTELYAAYRENRLDAMTGERRTMRLPLWETVDAWVETSARAPATRRRYDVSFKALRRNGAGGVLGPGAVVEDLAAVDWRALEAGWTHSASDWNHVRRAVSKFLSDQLGDSQHPFRRGIVKRIPLRPEAPRVPDITPELFRAIIEKAPDYVRPVFVTLAATGLRVGEFLRLTLFDLLPHTFSIKVPGTKTAASAAVIRVDESLWPWVRAAVPSPLRYKWLRIAWKHALEAAKADCTLRMHDLRHCTGQWLTDAGRPEASVQRTLRQATPAMTRRYTMQRDRGKDAATIARVLFGKKGRHPRLVPQPTASLRIASEG